MHSDSPKLAVKFGVDNWVYPLSSVSISGFNFVASLPTVTNTSSQSGHGSACGLLLLCRLRSCPLAEGLRLDFFLALVLTHAFNRSLFCAGFMIAGIYFPPYACLRRCLLSLRLLLEPRLQFLWVESCRGAVAAG